MPPQDLKSIPYSILISGGLFKADIIRAILVGGYVNCLVTDEAVAQRLWAKTELRSVACRAVLESAPVCSTVV